MAKTPVKIGLTLTAIPSYPEIVPIQDVGVNGRVLQSITLRINNITIVNEVSTAVP
jgi:hypothetical protein